MLIALLLTYSTMPQRVSNDEGDTCPAQYLPTLIHDSLCPLCLFSFKLTATPNSILTGKLSTS